MSSPLNPYVYRGQLDQLAPPGPRVYVVSSASKVTLVPLGREESKEKRVLQAYKE